MGCSLRTLLSSRQRASRSYPSGSSHYPEKEAKGPKPRPNFPLMTMMGRLMRILRMTPEQVLDLPLRAGEALALAGPEREA